MAVKPRTEDEVVRDIRSAERRLSDLELRGDEAMSRYDLSMGYSASSSSFLVRNQLAYFERELEEARRRGIQLSMFD